MSIQIHTGDFFRPAATLDEKVANAVDLITRVVLTSPDTLGAFSGGKDSQCIYHLAKMTPVFERIRWQYNVTTIDPPELVRFIRTRYKDVTCVTPPETFFELMERKGYPTRSGRWCCAELKEGNNPAEGGVLITGIRAEESARRAAKWSELAVMKKTNVRVCNPIFGWTIDDVWGFLRGNDIEYCSLYDEGMTRLGCVGCPMAYRRWEEMQRWPRLRYGWICALRSLWDKRPDDWRPKIVCRDFERFLDWYFQRRRISFVELDHENDVADGLAPCQLMFSDEDLECE